MNKAKALAYYNKTVECNLENIKNDQSLKDPDCMFTEEIIVCHPYMAFIPMQEKYVIITLPRRNGYWMEILFLMAER